MPRPRRDLTTGRIAPGVLSLAVPMIGSSAFQSLQTIVDMYFVGGLGPKALAAVGMAGTVLMVLVTVFMGVHTATVAMVARAVGADDDERAGHVCGQAILLMLAFSVATTAIGLMASRSILNALIDNPEVQEMGAQYLMITFGGMVFMCAGFVISGMLHGAGDAMTPLWLGVLATVSNIALTPVLIRGWLGFPALGVAGSAWATVASRTLSSGVGVVLLAKGKLHVRPALRHLLPCPHTLWRFVAIGTPGSMQMSVRMLMNLALMAIVAMFGPLAVAAYTVGRKVLMVGLMPLFGFAQASATMVGQNLGARRPERAVRSAWIAAGMGILAGAGAAALFFVFAPNIVGFFSDDPEVLAIGTLMLRITSLELVTAAVGIVLSRSMQGAGDTLSPLVITLIALWGFQIPCAVYLSGITELWGIAVPFAEAMRPLSFGSETGVWVAMLAASALHAAVVAFWFSRGGWKRKEA